MLIDTPKWARNTDGIDSQAGSQDISIISSYIRAGDDNISPKSNFQTGPVKNITVRDVHFYNGHGLGLGSQLSGGMSAIRVDGLSIDGSLNGIWIKSDKSRGSLVDDVQVADVCMRCVENPIVFDPFYTKFDGTRIPVYKRVLLRNVHADDSGPVTLAGLDEAHRLEATLDNVTISGEKRTEVAARQAIFTVHHGNLLPGGDDVKVTGTDGGSTPQNCAASFVPFPVKST